MNNFRNLSRPTPQEWHLSGRCSFLQQTDRFPLATSTFTVGTVTIGRSDYVLMVKNVEERRKDGSGTKPAGWGLPGGGVLDGEDLSVAAARELKSETGFTAVNPKWRRYDHNLLRPVPGGKFEYVRCERVVRDHIDPRKFERQTLVYTFTADLLWEGPAADAFELIRALTPDDLILRIDPEMGECLGIQEACKAPDGSQEIVALGLFPVSELPGYFECPPAGECFYRSHLSRAIKALELEPALVR